jgi:hypothetical protein
MLQAPGNQIIPPISAGNAGIREALETYLMHELLSYADYVSGESLGYWRSKSGFGGEPLRYAAGTAGGGIVKVCCR